MQSHETRQAIEAVKLAAPIEEIVRVRVPELKRAGAEWKACCPFHAEKTPSFYVNPAKGIWHCFGACGEGGDAIAFVQRFDGLSFWEAVEMLANQCGIALPKQRRAGPNEDSRFERLYDALDRAAGLYARKLAGPDGAAARAYLESRRLAGATAQAFCLGWAPEQGNALLDAARDSGVLERTLIEAGLARQRVGGEAFDFFRGRLIIPIRDRIGRIVGFGARLLPGQHREGPKYVNTPETPLFKKGSLVFGLDRALDHARRARHIVLVEGYTDVMAAHQVGIGNVVAVLGTSTTEEHAQLVRRTGAKRVSLIFDGDEAGRRAASRALHGLLPLGAFEIDVVPLPEGEDPADFLLRAGPDAFRERLAAPRPWFDFLLDGLIGLAPAALAEGVDLILGVIARLRQPVEQEALVRDVARRLGLGEEAVRAQWSALPQRRAGHGTGHGASHSSTRSSPVSGPMPGNKSPVSTVQETADVAPGGERPSLARSPVATQAVPVRDRLVRRAWGEIAGAMLLDNSLIPAYRPWAEAALGRSRSGEGASGEGSRLLAGVPPCPDPLLSRVIEVLLELHDEERQDADGEFLPVDPSALLTVLADEPAAQLPVNLYTHARRAESPRALVDGAVANLAREARQIELRTLRGTSRAEDDPDRERQKLEDLNRLLLSRRSNRAPVSGGVALAGPQALSGDTTITSDAPMAPEDEPPF